MTKTKKKKNLIIDGVATFLAAPALIRSKHIQRRTDKEVETLKRARKKVSRNTPNEKLFGALQDSINKAEAEKVREAIRKRNAAAKKKRDAAAKKKRELLAKSA